MAAPSLLHQGLPARAASPQTKRGSTSASLLLRGGSRPPVPCTRAPSGGTASPARAGRARASPQHPASPEAAARRGRRGRRPAPMPESRSRSHKRPGSRAGNPPASRLGPRIGSSL
ncbi:hypothetical protein NDU88_005034 [Pleurodeles waltl]|uniref:Uncharacterized protein n=1 Tax=Pleurodeles waltl TaxID=8319 RepID=A0AAV7SKK9_PLEWA|nr:hypothetical protein NDU88_005034 [Pleurodeles waltl]